MERLADEPHTRLRYFCSPQHTDGALYPIISQMERAAGLARDDAPKAKLDKLDALLGADVDLSARMPRCSPTCCRCRTTDAIRRSNSPRSSAGKERWRR